MKNGILIISTLCLFFACGETVRDIETVSPLITFENNKLEVMIQSHHTKAELLDLKKELKNNHNVNLDYTELSFASNGQIEKIRIEVDTNRGDSGSASSTNSLVQSPQVFFMIDYNLSLIHI